VGRMKSILGECLLFDSTRRLPAFRLTIYTLIVAASAAVVERGLLTRNHPFTKDGHAITSLEMALNAAVCGKPSTYALQFHPAFFISRNEWASYVPARQVMASVAGSVDAYCADLTLPYVNEDNSLGLLEESFLDARPTASADEVGRFLLLVRIGLIVAVCALFLSLGASVLFCTGMAIEALAISHALLNSGLGFSIYPFFFVLVLVNAAVVYGALRLAATRRVPLAVAGGLLSGFVAAASVNMRASYLPVYVAFQLCCWWAVWRSGDRRPAAAVMVSSVALAFAAGYVLFQYPFITRRVPADATGLRTDHAVSHPLVLSLAVPPNDLAKREGIEWLDEVGTTLALRVDPKSTYLGPGYERALFTYYRGLWRRHPREMARIYVTKLRLAGVHMLQYGARDPRLEKALWPLTWITNGLYLGGVYVLSAVAAFAIYRRRGSGLAFCIGLLCVAGFLLYLESAIIMPYYYVMYHNYLLFLSLFWCLLVYQAGVNGVARAFQLAVASRRTPGEKRV
jgi:hypothetical protein